MSRFVTDKFGDRLNKDPKDVVDISATKVRKMLRDDTFRKHLTQQLGSQTDIILDSLWEAEADEHTTTEICDLLRTAMTVEVPDFRFDYLSMHRTCHKAMQDIKAFTESKLGLSLRKHCIDMILDEGRWAEKTFQPKKSGLPNALTKEMLAPLLRWTADVTQNICERGHGALQVQMLLDLGWTGTPFLAEQASRRFAVLPMGRPSSTSIQGVLTPGMGNDCKQACGSSQNISLVCGCRVSVWVLISSVSRGL
jgi:hypothetical protein